MPTSARSTGSRCISWRTGVAVQNIVGPSSPLYAVQMHFGTTFALVKEPAQYLHAATRSSKGPSFAEDSALVVFVAARTFWTFRGSAALVTFRLGISDEKKDHGASGRAAQAAPMPAFEAPVASAAGAAVPARRKLLSPSPA